MVTSVSARCETGLRWLERALDLTAKSKSAGKV